MEIPLALIDFRAEHTWAAAHEKDHVGVLRPAD